MRLAELVADGVFVDGDWVESKDQDPEGDVRLIQLADVGDGVFVDKSARFLTSSKARELKCTFLERGDILVARMPDPLGRACFFPGVDQPCVTVVDVCIVRPGKRADRRWLLHAINSPSFRKQIERHIKGTTRQRISRTNLGTIELNVPDLPEQRRIADILDKADAICRKRKEAIALTEELLRSAFLEMFGDPMTNPKGWPVKALGELGRVTTGRTPPSAAPGMFNGPVPFVTPGDLGSREPVRRSLTVDGARESRVVRAGAALVCCIGATIGKMAKAPNELAFNQQINAIEWHSLVNDDFGITVLRFLKTRIAASASSTTLPILNKSSFEKLEIPVPPVAQQTLFSRRAEVCRKVSEAQEQTLSQADTFFNSLVARAFSGALGSAR